MSTINPFRILWIMLLPVSFCLHVAGQSGTGFRISGRITDSVSGRPLAGASISYEGKQRYGTTTLDGSFELVLRRLPDTLQVSFAGYKTKSYAIKDTSRARSFELRMSPDARELASVSITTGIQELSKERSTGAFDLVGNEQLNRGVSTDILSRLEGMASSVLFSSTAGGSREISIRGLSSLRNTIASPLIILDNFPYEGDLSNINPNDVQDVTILKDAVAASIWGARAGNGVIVIRTRKSNFNQALRWQINSLYTQTAEPRLYDYPMIKAPDFIETERWLFGKGYYDAALNNTTSRPVVSPVVELLWKHKNGHLSTEALNTALNSYAANDVRSNFLQHIYRPAQTLQNNLQLTVGGNQLSMLASGGYDKQILTLQGDEASRATARMELSGRPIKGVEWGAGIIYTGTTSNKTSEGGFNGINIGGGKAGFIYPYAQLADENGNWVPYEKDYRQGFTDTAGGGLLKPWKYNPVLERSTKQQESLLHHYLGRLFLKWQLANFLEAELRWQQERSFGNTNSTWGEDSYFVRNLLNRFSQISAGQVTNNIPVGGIQDKKAANELANNYRLQFNGRHRWAQWNLEGLAGAEARSVVWDGSEFRNYGFNANTLSVANVNYVTAFPQYANLSGPAQVPNRNSLSGGTNRFLSVFMNAALQWRRQYQFNMSARKDASNILGVSTNQSGVPLWSVGVGWRPSLADWWKNRKVESLGIRITYGSSGNVDNSLSPLTTISYSPASGSIINQSYAGIRTPANASLRWEKVYQTNLGIDFSLFKKRISGNIDLYQKMSTDLLVPVSPDPTTGQSQVTINTGDLRVRGIDLQLNTVLVPGAFNWNIDWLLHWNDSKILNYPLSPQQGNAYVGLEKTINPREGYPAYGVYSYVSSGLEGAAGNPVGWLNGEVSQNYGAIVSTTTAQDLKFHGSARPVFFGSVRNNWSWKGLSVSANVLLKWGHYMRNNSIQYSTYFGNWVGHSDYYKRWQQPGDELHTYVPSMQYPVNNFRDNFYINSEVLVQKADYLRLLDLQFSCQIPEKWKKKLKLRQCQLYGLWQPGYLLYQANNTNVDPETVDGVRAPAAWSVGLRFGTL